LLTRAQKTEQVGELKEKFSRATSVYVADFRGLDVQAMNSLRKRIRNEGRGDYEYRVAKNTILRRAADGSKVADIATHFEGPTVIALSPGPGRSADLTEFARTRGAEAAGRMLEGARRRRRDQPRRRCRECAAREDHQADPAPATQLARCSEPRRRAAECAPGSPGRGRVNIEPAAARQNRELLGQRQG
jgi:hypothetical protein